MIPGIVRHVERSQRKPSRYGAWIAAVSELRADLKEGQCVEIDKLTDYLEGVRQEDQGEALQDLVAAHLNWRWSHEQGECLEAYRELLDAYGVAWSAGVVEDEFLARYQKGGGDYPSLDEYADRFDNRSDVMGRLSSRVMGEGRYVRIRKIGQGAMGVVSEAYDYETGERVAIKEPTKACLADADLLAHFAVEAQVSIGLEHAGVVSVERYVESETPFCVMRLAEGPHLGEKIRAYHRPRVERSVSETKAVWRGLVESFVEVCDAMGYAHGRGVAHRDLKPGNVVVQEVGGAVILDWGMGATIHEDAGQQNNHANDLRDNELVAGTPEYMAPEQAMGQWGVKSDVFGLGSMLYEMLTERSPHDWSQVGRPDDWRDAVVACCIADPRSLKSRAPRGMVDICLKALSSDPDQRHTSATELAQAVRDEIQREARGWLGWRSWVKG